MANFDPDGSGSLYFAKSGSLQDRALVDPNTPISHPASAFPTRLDDKTVVRGGYGIYYTLFERIGSEDQLALNPPFLINKTDRQQHAPVLMPAGWLPLKLPRSRPPSI